MHFNLEHNSSISCRRWVSLVFTLLAIGVVAPAAASPTVVTIHSGTGIPGGVDSTILNYNGGGHNPSCGVPLSQQPFSATNFNVDTNQVTYVVNPTLALPNFALPGYPTAQWVNWSKGVGNNGSPGSSALYAQKFNLPVQNVCSAMMTFCWVTDDLLGDEPPWIGANPTGVYINGVSIPAIHGGNRNNPTCVTVDVSALVHPGGNTLTSTVATPAAAPRV